MFSGKELPSSSSLLAAYASMAGSIMMAQSIANQLSHLIPHQIRGYFLSTLRYFFKPQSPVLTLVIEESTGIARNQIYDASETYLCTKVSPRTKRLKISKTPKERNFTIKLEKGEKIVDHYEGIELKWRLVFAEADKNDSHNHLQPKNVEKRWFELSFHRNHKETILGSYLPYILGKAKSIKEEDRILKMHTLGNSQGYGGIKWESINLEHPASFETLAMEPDLKDLLIQDLNRFVKRKDFYKRVGRAWKRGYLLYGPPGTGKSSLVAAMANHLKFDVYDLQLANIMRDSDLRRLFLATGNRSILVIEDIDCSLDLPDRRQVSRDEDSRKTHDVQLTLSGLLNFIDGLWSSCGDERIIIFTTNHKDRLDPALLRPGRMDMHIHMSYCTAHGFRVLATNYLGINGYHSLFGEIEDLIKTTEITPAQVAEQLLKSEDSNVALEGLVKLLKRKKLEGDELFDEGGKMGGIQEAKRQKVERKRRVSVRINGGRKTNKRRCS
ncbi:BCS1 AAA-TYPE ATPASE [Salix purpurea]|uniref:BCS1 AAA-TYPE ATPASE n=1 Tax=Salix purpurea TaxID=77065 RepID=A0A9Q0WZI4_SALPP|nr:BCS1 AAA-TYPE ATPASE [Salix purpurea]